MTSRALKALPPSQPRDEAVRLQKIRPVELPLSWSNGDEEVRIRTQHHLPSKPADVVIQILVIFFVVAAHQHNTHKICE